MDMTDNKSDNLGQLTAADDELLEQLFRPLRTMQVTDDGFTQRVMEQLPVGSASRSVKLSRLWTIACIALAVLLFIALKGWYIIGWSIITLLNHPPSPYMLLTLVALLALTMTIVTHEVIHRYRYSF